MSQARCRCSSSWSASWNERSTETSVICWVSSASVARNIVYRDVVVGGVLGVQLLKENLHLVTEDSLVTRECGSFFCKEVTACIFNMQWKSFVDFKEPFPNQEVYGQRRKDFLVG